MKPYIYVSDGKILDRNMRKYDICICFSDNKEDTHKNEGAIWETGFYFTPIEFEKYIHSKQPYGIRLIFNTQEEFEYLIDQIHPFVRSLNIQAKHSMAFDLRLLERCSDLEAVQFYWNTKQEHLWDFTKNTKLKNFEMMDYYSVSDFSALRGSSIEKLGLFGCNSLSSFVSKLHIKDLTFLLDMPHLRELHLDIIKDEGSEYYLKLFARCQNLHTLTNPDSFFTFQQYAWLKAHLPNVTRGLDCASAYGASYSIIGRRMPKSLTECKKVEQYKTRYDALVEKYRFRENPPSDNEKD